MVDATVGESVADRPGGFVLGASGTGGPGLLRSDPSEGVAVVISDGAAVFAPSSLALAFPPLVLDGE
jgi:hypothetical protein